MPGLIALNRIAIEVIHPAEFPAHADGPINRRTGDAQHLLNLINQFNRVADIPIEFIHKGDNGGVAETADIHQLDGSIFHTLCAINHHERGIDGGERPVSVLRKVLVPGCI